ncbi:MAG: STAS domain-containing protein [Candidatus Melainabacteria bacterium]|nr:STAS domain-containing protein [Candidatus Melainabacteria bacterium]
MSPIKRNGANTGDPVRIMGSLDRGKVDVDKLIAQSKEQIVLDFATCTFISVEGLEWLEELVMRAASSKLDVRFENIPPTIYKVFKVSHIDGILKACGAPSSRLGPVC